MSSIFFSGPGTSPDSSNGSNFGQPLSTVTPHTSFDSLGSFQSLSSASSKTSSFPPGSGLFGAVGSSSLQDKRMNYSPTDFESSAALGQLLSKRPSLSQLSAPGTQTTSDSELMTEGMSYVSSAGLGLDRSLHSGGSSQASVNIWKTNPQTIDRRASSSSLKGRAANSRQSTNLNLNMGPGPSSDNSMEQIYQDMTKSLEEKERTIKKLQLELEAVWTSICVAGKDQFAFEQLASKTPSDPTALAHRLIMRMQSLADENKMLGEMLSYGRAAQKELELGALRRENQNLKERLKPR